MTNQESLALIAERINGMFKQYGLDHDVVEVINTTVLGGIKLDERENEPDPMKWRAVARVTAPEPRLSLVNCHNVVDMEILWQTLKYVFEEYFKVHPPEGQMRLF